MLERPFGFAFPYAFPHTSANLFSIGGPISSYTESRRSWYLLLARSSSSLLYSSSSDLTLEEYELKESWSPTPEVLEYPIRFYYHYYLRSHLPRHVSIYHCHYDPWSFPDHLLSEALYSQDRISS